MPRYYPVEQGKNTDLKRSDKMAAQNEWRNGGIINPIFDGLTYNTSGHFALHCSYFPRPYGARKNTTQLAKYPRVSYVKQSNKMYLSSSIFLGYKFHLRKLPLGKYLNWGLTRVVAFSLLRGYLMGCHARIIA